jgi:protein required for attachment to host cells
MEQIRIKARDWVVVCDGRKALILENVGNAIEPRLQTKESRQHADAPTRDQGSDAPPRVVWPASGQRSAIEQPDWHDEAERKFLEGLAERLERAVSGGETERLIMVAPPRALGMIRETYSSRLRGAIGAEIEKDYTRMPVREIERQLTSRRD